jgi:hypothetical protein
MSLTGRKRKIGNRDQGTGIRKPNCYGLLADHCSLTTVHCQL